MPGQLQGTLGNGVGAIVALAFIQRNGFDHPFRRLVFALERGQRQTEDEFGLIWRELWRRHEDVLSRDRNYSNRTDLTVSPESDVSNSASRTPSWLPSGWGYRGQHPSTR